MKNRKGLQRELLLTVLRAMDADGVGSANVMIRSFAERVKGGHTLTESQVALLIASGRSMSLDMAPYLGLLYDRPDKVVKIKVENQMLLGLEELAAGIFE